MLSTGSSIPNFSVEEEERKPVESKSLYGTAAFLVSRPETAKDVE